MRQEIESRTIDGVLTKVIFDDKTEYIERGALMNEIEKHFETIGANAQRLVARFPASDVEPVVHAHWEEWDCEDGTYQLGWECSNCHIHTRGYNTKRCYNCGAHMDERSEHED